MTLWRRTTKRYALGAGPLAWVLVWAPFAGCDNHRPLGPLHDGVAACQRIADECAPFVASGEPYRDCHDTALVGDGDACLEHYDACIAACSAAPSGGAGGEAGANAQAGASGAGATSAGGEGGA